VKRYLLPFLLSGLVLLIGQACKDNPNPPHSGPNPPGPHSHGTAHGTLGPELLPMEELKTEVAAQKRISTFFHDEVDPHLKSCWASIQGKGDIRMEYTFVRGDGAWMPPKVILAHSTMPEEQNDAALRCMEEAVKDASLRIDASDGDTKELFISWSWPVPSPKDPEAQYLALQGASGGGGKWGCDGRGTPAKCKRCVGSGASSCCVTVCVGYQSCGFSRSGGKVVGCFNDPPTQCVSGGQTGVSGGLIMF
jgi:hypothetical protein